MKNRVNRIAARRIETEKPPIEMQPGEVAIFQRFTKSEVTAMCSLLAKLDMAARDVPELKTLARSERVISLRAKFQTMRDDIERREAHPLARADFEEV